MAGFMTYKGKCCCGGCCGCDCEEMLVTFSDYRIYNDENVPVPDYECDDGPLGSGILLKNTDTGPCNWDNSTAVDPISVDGCTFHFYSFTNVGFGCADGKWGAEIFQGADTPFHAATFGAIFGGTISASCSPFEVVLSVVQPGPGIGAYQFNVTFTCNDSLGAMAARAATAMASLPECADTERELRTTEIVAINKGRAEKGLPMLDLRCDWFACKTGEHPAHKRCNRSTARKLPPSP